MKKIEENEAGCKSEASGKDCRFMSLVNCEGFCGYIFWGLGVHG